VIDAFIAETSTPTTAAYAGLGREVITATNGFQTPRAYAATLVLFAFAVACFYALSLAERVLVPWQNRPRGVIT
jgi:ABC-type nitrate/sulfonate/bicarbonate transport system permease component